MRLDPNKRRALPGAASHLSWLRARLRKPGTNLTRVATGAGVGLSWLLMFNRGRIKDPSFRRVVALSNYLVRMDAR